MAHSVDTVKLWLDRIFDHEAGFTDNPKDPGNWTGGAIGVGQLKGTKYGIAANTYGHLDIKNLTLDDAANIYLNDFLKPLKADNCADGVAYQLLDYAVNSGVFKALKGIQKAVGVKQDGIIGTKTLAALNKYSESDLIMLVLAERINFLTYLHNWDDAGRGWMRRMAKNLCFGAEDSD